ncbi:MAG: DUF192 domain-containing protein [bacterium]|nr:DUF192 domain-containing protein [bacterium]
MKLLFLVAFVCIAGFLVFSLKDSYITQESFTEMVSLKGHQLSVEIADTPAKQGQGLSERVSMKEGEGMLFVFQHPHIPSFWMKDMHFPLDIIWIDESRAIVGIERNVPTSSFPQTFSPTQPVLYVLELNASWADRYGVVVGDRITW